MNPAGTACLWPKIFGKPFYIESGWADSYAHLQGAAVHQKRIEGLRFNAQAIHEAL